MHTVHRSTLPVYVDSKAKFPNFSLPTVVGYFSLDAERRFHADTSQLRYVYFPRSNANLAWDLNIGLENVHRADDSKKNERIDHLLRGILASGISIRPEVAGFVCFRGLLTTIMTTPYEQSQGWEILVSKFKGILYMCAHETEEQRKHRMAEDERLRKFSSWGFKFEHFLMSETPNEEPDVKKPVNEGEEFCCLFRTKLNNHRLLFGAEMDGVRSKEMLQNSLSDVAQAEFVELKTSRRFDTMRQERNFKRYKLLKWWAQSFLVGIKNIVCGFRNDSGIVDNIQFYPLQEIPKMAKDMWVPAVCMTFLDQFLTFVENTVNHSNNKNDPRSVWRFRWEPGVQFVTVDEFPGQSNFSFLPDWYLSSTTSVDHHTLRSFVPHTSMQSESTSSQSGISNTFSDIASGVQQSNSLIQTISHVDNISPNSTIASSTALDNILPQDLVNPSSYDLFMSNSFIGSPSTSCDIVTHQSYVTPTDTGYLSSLSENHPNHAASTNNSFSYMPVSSGSSSLDGSGVCSVPSPTTSVDPLYQFMGSNPNADMLSCQSFLQADKLPPS